MAKSPADGLTNFNAGDTPDDVKARLAAFEANKKEAGQDAPPGKWSCPMCGSVVLSRNSKRHLMNVHDLEDKEADQVIKSGESPEGSEVTTNVFPQAAGEVITMMALMLAQRMKQKYYKDPRAQFEIAPDFLEKANQLHQALLEKYLGPAIGEYSLETSLILLWGTTIYANFATPPPPVIDADNQSEGRGKDNSGHQPSSK